MAKRSSRPKGLRKPKPAKSQEEIERTEILSTLEATLQYGASRLIDRMRCERTSDLDSEDEVEAAPPDQWSLPILRELRCIVCDEGLDVAEWQIRKAINHVIQLRHDTKGAPDRFHSFVCASDIARAHMYLQDGNLLRAAQNLREAAEHLRQRRYSHGFANQGTKMELSVGLRNASTIVNISTRAPIAATDAQTTTAAGENDARSPSLHSTATNSESIGTVAVSAPLQGDDDSNSGIPPAHHITTPVSADVENDDNGSDADFEDVIITTHRPGRATCDLEGAAAVHHAAVPAHGTVTSTSADEENDTNASSMDVDESNTQFSNAGAVAYTLSSKVNGADAHIPLQRTTACPSLNMESQQNTPLSAFDSLVANIRVSGAIPSHLRRGMISRHANEPFRSLTKSNPAIVGSSGNAPVSKLGRITFKLSATELVTAHPHSNAKGGDASEEQASIMNGLTGDWVYPEPMQGLEPVFSLPMDGVQYEVATLTCEALRDHIKHLRGRGKKRILAAIQDVHSPARADGFAVVRGACQGDYVDKGAKRSKLWYHADEVEATWATGVAAVRVGVWLAMKVARHRYAEASLRLLHEAHFNLVHGGYKIVMPSIEQEGSL